ncbi:MAG: tripartite tricarboxylate transporter TctB family protein [Actinomycetes bacterium]
MTRTITGANLRKAVASLIIALIGIAAVIGGFGYGFIEDGRITAGFLPVLVGGAMALFALLDVVGSVRSREKESTLLETAQVEAVETLEPVSEPESDLDIYGRTGKQRDRMLLMVIGIILATVLLVPILGFLVAFALMLIVIAVVVERRRLLPSILVSTVALAAAYGIFVLFLRVPLPTGILGI